MFIPTKLEWWIQIQVYKQFLKMVGEVLLNSYLNRLWKVKQERVRIMRENTNRK